MGVPGRQDPTRRDTWRAALARELREELGVATTIGREIFRARHNYAERGVSVELAFFTAGRLFPAPRNVVFERIAWVWPSDLMRYDFLVADRMLIIAAAARRVRTTFCEGSPRRDFTGAKAPFFRPFVSELSSDPLTRRIRRMPG